MTPSRGTSTGRVEHWRSVGVAPGRRCGHSYPDRADGHRAPYAILREVRAAGDHGAARHVEAGGKGGGREGD